MARWYNARGAEEKCKNEVHLHLLEDLTTREKCTARDERLQNLTERWCHHIYEWRERERAKETVLKA